jgi:hypothetical protein
VEIRQFKELLDKLNKMGHPDYVIVFSGISEIGPGEHDALIMSHWEKGISQFVQMGATSGILVDQGSGLWVELTTFWKKKWFSVTEDVPGCAQVIDRYILRHKMLLQLQMDRQSMKSFDGPQLIMRQAMEFKGTQWPVSSQTLDEREDLPNIYDPEEDEEEAPDNHAPVPKDSISTLGSTEALRVTYEILGEGQPRYWNKTRLNNCCENAKDSFVITRSLPVCELPDRCLFCRARETAKQDEVYNIAMGLTAAQLKIYALANTWSRLPDQSMFAFIMEVNNRITGDSLRKDLSHWGGVRSTGAEIQRAIETKYLSQHYCYSTYSHGKRYTRGIQDMTNQVYAL